MTKIKSVSLISYKLVLYIWSFKWQVSTKKNALLEGRVFSKSNKTFFVFFLKILKKSPKFEGFWLFNPFMCQGFRFSWTY